MMKQELIIELGKILEEDYGLELSDTEINEFGENLVSTFNLLYESDLGLKFVTRPRRFIDTL